jgi:hypothetical protein
MPKVAPRHLVFKNPQRFGTAGFFVGGTCAAQVVIESNGLARFIF